MADFGDYVKDYDEETDLEVLVEPWQKYDIKKDRKHVEFSLCHTFAKARQALRGQSPRHNLSHNRRPLVSIDTHLKWLALDFFLMTWLTSAIM
jgi:hypothetical protein